MALVKVGAAWIRDGKKGKFMSVKLTLESGDLSLLLFKNKFKEPGDKKPDYEAFVTVDDERQEDPPPAARPSRVDDFPGPDDDVPFSVALPFLAVLPMLGAWLA